MLWFCVPLTANYRDPVAKSDDNKCVRLYTTFFCVHSSGALAIVMSVLHFYSLSLCSNRPMKNESLRLFDRDRGKRERHSTWIQNDSVFRKKESKTEIVHH